METTEKQNEPEEKGMNLTPILILVVLILLGVVVVLMWKPITDSGNGAKPEESTSQTTSTTKPADETNARDVETEKEAGADTTGTATDNGTTDTTGKTEPVKADIDNDIKTLDDLDLSGPEDIYGDNALDELNQ